MSKNELAPTMIIPSGTEIQIDVHGQLSVRTPGNLVIQNSGHYGEIESVHGSIRIEAGAEVEAVSVRCAETCYVQGSLTSWKVKAKSIQLEEKAQARVVLQETESVEIGKNAKLVGNFDSEKELFLLFSRFARQLRNMPFYFDRAGGDPTRIEDPSGGGSLPPAPSPMAPQSHVASTPGVPRSPSTSSGQAVSGPARTGPPTTGQAAAGQAARGSSGAGLSGTGPSGVGLSGIESIQAPKVGPQRPQTSGGLANELLDANQELPDQLFFSLVLLERESKNETYGSGTRKVVEDLVRLLRSRDFGALRNTHQGLSERLVEPGEDLRRAVELIRNHFVAEAEAQPQEA